jgi:uncharacterized protein YecT (DUF1311 family)
MTKSRLALSVAFATFLPAAGAMSDPIMECPGSSQVEIGECLAKTEELANLSLQTALEIARNAATELDTVTGRSVVLPALEEGHKTWSAYRDAHCDYIGANFGGGSGTGLGIRACRIELTRDRVASLMNAL